MESVKGVLYLGLLSEPFLISSEDWNLGSTGEPNEAVWNAT